MTEQEIFDKAYLGLKSQGFELSTNEKNCRYRAKNGNRCAIGWCISDKDYNSTWENFGVDALPYKKLFPKISVNFLLLLQRAHDVILPEENENGERLKNSLHKFADTFKFKIPEE